MELKVEIYLIDHKGKTLQRIGIADSDEGILEILQYLIDGMGADRFDDEVAVKYPLNDKYIYGANMTKVRERYGLRKRTFDEKLANYETWREKLEEIRRNK